MIELNSKIKEALIEIDFIKRYEEVSNKFNAERTPSKSRLVYINGEEVMEIIQDLGYSPLFDSKEKFYKIREEQVERFTLGVHIILQGGMVDLVMERFTEILTGIPWIVIMTITKMLLFGHINNIFIVAISLVLTSWTGTASMVRSQMYRYKNREYVLSSRTLGAKDMRLIFKHILPNALGTIVTSCVLVIPSAIFFESSVAYLGLGVDASTVSIGNLLNLGRDLGIVQYPYLTLFPALLISVLMISFNMFGNGLRDALNPSLRGSE